MRRAVNLASLSSLVLSTLISSAAFAQNLCGTTYTIRSGDTLSGIASIAFGDASLWQRVYRHAGNSRVIGLNPNLVIPGIVIEIPPCESEAGFANIGGGANPAPAAPGASVTATSLNRQSNLEVATLNAALARRARIARPAPEARIEILSPGGFSPVSEEEWPGGGLATQIIEAAFKTASQNKKVQIDFVGDRDAHLSLLLRYNKFEFGFPWTKPDCSRVNQLPEDSKLLCEYEFSDPIYVAAIKVYAPKNLVAPPRRFEDLRDSTICRPAGVPIHDLYDHGLIDGQTVVIERPSSTELCFTMLERGEVDYVSDFQFPAEKALSDLSLSPYVAAIPGLVDAAPLHLIAHGDNAEAAYLLMDRFNAGLANLRASGEWDQIVNGQIRQFRGTILQ